MAKRRLPVVQTPAEPDEPPRPPWHWSGFGAVAIFVAWLPLASLAEWIKGRTVPAFLGTTTSQEETAARIEALSSADRARLTAILIGLPAIALTAGAFAGGWLIGRYGDGVKPHHGAVAGASAGMVAAVLACIAGGFSSAPFVAVPLAALASALGTSAGRRRGPIGEGRLG